MTPPIKMEKGKTYKLSFTVSALASVSPGTVSAAVGNSYAPEDYDIKVVDATTVKSASGIILSGTFSVPADGEYHVGFHATSPKGFSTMNLDDVEVLEDSASGISGVRTDGAAAGGDAYTVDGRKAVGSGKGVVIVRGADGKYRKVAVAR